MTRSRRFDLRSTFHIERIKFAGCSLIIYPGAFNMTTGPLHWKLLARARACDNQVYVAAVSPASDPTSDYVAYGHTMLVNPLAEVEVEAEGGETILYSDIGILRTYFFASKLILLVSSRNFSRFKQNHRNTAEYSNS
jgi:predicted amidohydrolase